MLRIKNVAVAATVMLGVASGVCAVGIGGLGLSSAASPVSFTSVSTNGLFSTDVDDFLDVNSWYCVAPEKLFGYFGYDIGSAENSNLNFGVAKQFKKIYVGTFFGGKFDGFTTNATSNDADGADKSSSSLKSKNDGAFTVASLFGFGSGLGLKFSVYYKPTSITNDDKTDNDSKKYSSYDDKFLIFPELSVGSTVKNDKVTLTPHASVGLDSHVNIKTVNNDGTKNVDDNSVYILTASAGTGFSWPEKDGISKSASVDMNTYWSLYALETKNYDGKKTTEFGHVDNTVNLFGKYTVAFSPVEKLSVKVRGVLPVLMDFHCDPEYADVDGTKAYTPLRNNKTNISVTPDLMIAAQYSLLKDRVFFNAGFDFSTPSLNWNINRAETKDESSVKSTEWTNDFSFLTADMSYALNCGFSVLLGKKVTFDANYNILSNIFGGKNFVNTSNLFNTGGSIWNAPGKVFGANFNFLLTLKL